MAANSSDSGESLLEVLLAIAIIGIAFAAVLAGLGTAVTTSGINREQADDTAYVRAIAERIEAAPFTSCATASDYELALAGTSMPSGTPAIASPSGSTRSLSVAYWNGTTFGMPCTPATDLHRITVTTIPQDGRATAPQPLQVVKRKP